MNELPVFELLAHDVGVKNFATLCRVLVVFVCIFRFGVETNRQREVLTVHINSVCATLCLTLPCLPVGRMAIMRILASIFCV